VNDRTPIQARRTRNSTIDFGRVSEDAFCSRTRSQRQADRKTELRHENLDADEDTGLETGWQTAEEPGARTGPNDDRNGTNYGYDLNIPRITRRKRHRRDGQKLAPCAPDTRIWT